MDVNGGYLGQTGPASGGPGPAEAWHLDHGPSSGPPPLERARELGATPTRPTESTGHGGPFSWPLSEGDDPNLAGSRSTRLCWPWWRRGRVRSTAPSGLVDGSGWTAWIIKKHERLPRDHLRCHLRTSQGRAQVRPETGPAQGQGPKPAPGRRPGAHRHARGAQRPVRNPPEPARRAWRGPGAGRHMPGCRACPNSWSTPRPGTKWPGRSCTARSPWPGHAGLLQRSL